MQQESDTKLYRARLDRLHAVRGETWAQVAADLGVSVAMLMMVRTGKRNLSAKAIYRLQEAERAAGIPAPAARQTASAPFFNPANDPEIAARAWQILDKFTREIADLPPARQDRLRGYILDIFSLTLERAAAPAMAYMESLRKEIARDRARETSRAKLSKK
jgi:transcriptional regulator with XRE-family HTH domain